MNANLFARFREQFAGRASDPCLIQPDATLTYGELEALSARFAAALARAGVRDGDRVVAQVEKSAGAVALYLAALRAGAVFVPLNTAYTPHEVAWFLQDAGPRLFVCAPERLADVREGAAAAGAAVATMSASPRDHLWAECIACAPDDRVAERAQGDLAAILYTSGTTGRPKGAMLSHGNLAANALALQQAWDLQPTDVLVHALPIFHIHGLFVALNTAFLGGARVIFLPAFDAEAVRRRLADATVFMGVPTFYSRLLELADFGPGDCANLRLFVSGSAPLTEALSDAFFARTGHRILERYGMTETGIIASNPLEGERVAGSVGLALPDTSVRIADGAGREVARGDIGVIEVKGPGVFTGYWRRPEKSAAEFRNDGFFVTGDLGAMDEEGRIRIVGRAKDLIISGGYNIYPKEIEAVLDAIGGVAESAVIGAPHADLGEGVVAVLVAASEPVSLDKVQAALDARLARFKHPRRFYWVSALPRNAMGKVQKSELAVRFRDAYAV